MLVLSRNANEQVIINPGTPYECIVAVVDVRGSKVKLGFNAAPHIVIHRREVVEANKRKNGQADQSAEPQE